MLYLLLVHHYLYVRALRNLSSPVDSALSMDVIPKDLRLVYTSVVNFIYGYCEYIEWSFYRKDFICPPIGYQQAYFIAVTELYAIAGMVLYHGLHTFNHKESEIVLVREKKDEQIHLKLGFGDKTAKELLGHYYRRI